jgi:hypothetical protein
MVSQPGAAPSVPSDPGQPVPSGTEQPLPSGTEQPLGSGSAQSLPPNPSPPGPPGGPAVAGLAAKFDERPELAAGAAFAGGFVLALILKRLAR